MGIAAARYGYVQGPTRWLAILLCLACSGCSLVFTRPVPATRPPQTTEQSEPAEIDCTSSRLAPVADTLGGIPLAGLAVLLVAVPEFDDNPKSQRTGSLVGAVVGATALFASAAYGFNIASDCENARTRDTSKRRKRAAQPN